LVREPVCPVEYSCVEKKGAAMRKHRILQSFAVVGLAVTFTGGSSAIAEEYRGTMQQQMACTPDVFRLCGSAIPDTNRIVACLQANTPQLSAGCRAVFDSSDSATIPPPNAPQPAPPPVRHSQYQ
jgi:hypothetical protein